MRRGVLEVPFAAPAIWRRSVKTGGTGHGNKEKSEVFESAVTMGQHISNIVVSLDVLRFPFFSGTGPLESQIAQLLHAFIDFAQLHAGLGLATDGLQGSFFHTSVRGHISFVDIAILLS